MHNYSHRLEYKIIFGGEPNEVFPKVGIKSIKDCGCGNMGTLQNRLDSLAEDMGQKWGLTQAKSEIYSCSPSPAYDTLKSVGRPPTEGTVLMEIKFKNQKYLNEIKQKFSDMFGMDIKYLDMRLLG